MGNQFDLNMVRPKAKRVLVVDDEADLREILTFNLESEDYEVTAASCAEEMLRITDPYSFDIILLDVMMPGISGFRLAEQLRRQKPTDKAIPPIIFLTAKDAENDLLTGFSLGADDYVTKPFSVKELQARIRAVLNRVEASQSKVPRSISSDNAETFIWGNLTIDFRKQQAMIGNEPMVLTKKEFEILKLLSSEPERVFSRTEILNRVWRYNNFVMERTVDVHITRLRKKIVGSHLNIVNRSGYGYCMMEE